jgi:hypothetical protein
MEQENFGRSVKATEGAIQEERVMRGGTWIRETENRRESKQRESETVMAEDWKQGYWEKETERLFLFRSEDCGQLKFF